MAEAAFYVSFAGPLVTFQDAGRPGNMRYGVAASGPMDRLAFEQPMPRWAMPRA
jgi:allophanate hydrolase